MFVYFGERESESGGGAEKGRQNLKQAPGSELSAQNLMRGSNSTSCEIMTWAKVRCLIDWATQAPESEPFNLLQY